MADAAGNILKLRKLHAAQKYIGRHARRFNGIACGRRFGKTDFGLNRCALAKKAILNGQPVGWFAPNYKYLDDPWRAALRLFRPMIKSKDKTARRIEFRNGALLDFWTLDDPDAGRSRKYGHVIIDEAAKVRGLLDIWQQSIRPTLSDLEGTADFLSTPKGANDFKTIFDYGRSDPDHGLIQLPDWQAFQFATSANPFIKTGEIAAAEADLPALVFAQEYLAKFVDFGGTAVKREWLKSGDVFKRWRREQLRIGMGVDLAIGLNQQNDYTAIVVVAMDPEGFIWVIWSHRERLTFHRTMQLVIKTANDWQVQRILVEEVQYQAAVVQELLRTTPLNVQGYRPDRDKVTRFQPMATRYEKGLVWHSYDLPAVFEAELLAFPPQSTEDHDDQVDALTLAHMAAAGYELGQTVESVGDRVATGTGHILTDDGDTSWGTVTVTTQPGLR